MSVYRIAPGYLNDVIDSLLRGTSTGYVASLGSSLYLTLLKNEPYLSGDLLYFDTEHEVSYSGYARRSVPRTLSGFLSTQGNTSVSSGTSGTVRPAADSYFPVCTSSSEVVTHAALALSNTRTSTYNEVLVYWELPRPFQLTNTTPGLYPCMFAERLTISLDT